MYLARFEVVLAGEGSEEEVMFKKRKKEETQTSKDGPIKRHPPPHSFVKNSRPRKPEL
jgi:hypothetical protein